MSDSNRPKLGALNHASIPVRDLKEAKRFYTEVLGGEVVLESNPKFAEVRLGGAIFGLSEQEGGWTAPNAEFPHYAFTMSGADFYPFIEHLKACGVSTHHPWTRHGVEALMYFRDPSGNSWSCIASVGRRMPTNYPVWSRRAEVWSSTSRLCSMNGRDEPQT